MLENVRLKKSEILGVFVNTLTADDKYSHCNRKNLPDTIQLQFSKKRKNFSQFCSPYLKSVSNIEDFGKKDGPRRLCIFEIRDCKRSGLLNVQKVPFQKPLQHSTC